MKFQFAPKGNYTIGQVITVNGRQLRVESYSHTGRNLIAHTLENAPRFERFTIVLTDAQPISA